MYAEVIVDIAHSEVDKIFEYSFSENEELKPGCRVVVPFGKTKLEGVVMAVKSQCEFAPEKIKGITRVIDEMPVLTAECLQLVAEMTAKYHVPTALVMRLFLPSEMRKGKVKAAIDNIISINPDISAIEAVASIPDRATSQKKLLGYMCENKRSRLADISTKFGASAVAKLVERGYLIRTQERRTRSPYVNLPETEKHVSLTSAQRKAVDTVESGPGCYLIHGVTGSGKTEVYLSLIKKVIEKGKTAIMLVPEIALTPQMLSQLRARFKDEAAILHSGLSAGERFDEWCRLRNGEARIAIGARSAIFAPVENVGLIIIDEEHDGSYSSESPPRYNTVDVAAFRREYNGCALVLGSATPSIESYVAAKDGRYKLIEMPERINKRPLPEMLITDMRNEIRRGNSSAFSAVLRDELGRCLKEGNQAIIFLNRRGFSNTVICQECGYVARCEACDVSLTYHMDGDVLKCHYCNAQYKMPESCPSCGSKHIRYGGTGTERVVVELKKLFPEARILRMDNDTTRNKDGHLKILSSFGAHEADILVGTQMVAKGHDFPSVTLVGILDADMSLYFSDYRSRERTFQLLTQVSGRCGRADKKGVVVLQTFSPEHPVLRYASAYDYEGFVENEAQLRRATGFPPFADIVRVMVSSDDDALAMETLRLIFIETEKIHSANTKKFYFFNKMKSPVKRINNKFRYQILMRIESGCEKIIDEIYNVSLSKNSKRVLVYVEINPNSLI